MTTRYYEETSCGTCRGTGWIPDEPDGWDVPDMSMSGCPDCQPGIGGTGVGQRRELTIKNEDFEIAAQAWDAFQAGADVTGADDFASALGAESILRFFFTRVLVGAGLVKSAIIPLES